MAVAESLTAGRISSFLGRGEAASEWYSGAVVAYDEEVRFDVRSVTRAALLDGVEADPRLAGAGARWDRGGAAIAPLGGP